ncbi:hypothetical protein RUM44_005226 [Polyplax serrata]|uniref:Uncharacterized protein n=1 Tax=Polyplax serrata TaxID=468196 RepID=A0ABR1AFR6_POLSC
MPPLLEVIEVKRSPTIATRWNLHCEHCVRGICYFPPGLQGQFEMQSSLAEGQQVQYSPVNITIDAIPIWGQCHKKVGNNFILRDESGGGDCIRCFHLNLRSKNVLQVLTEGLDKCYTSEEAARNTCPKANSVTSHVVKEILLYKVRDMNGEPTKREYCPINGKFSFIYNINDGSDTKVECPYYTSQADNCPSGSTFNLHFKRCSFEDHDITFDCLGHWDGPNNQKYLTLLDTRVGGDQRPHYRCALFQEDSKTGIVNIAFSSDSTCGTDLVSATEGYEVLTLQKQPESEWPVEVMTSICRFPNWSQGVWEHLHIDGNGLTYRDHSSFKTYNLRCIGSDTGVRERIPVYVKSHCGEEKEYNCLWLKKRSNNVLEFQLSQKASAYYDDTLCDDENFDSQIWITQARLDRSEESPCPVSGLYTGNIPDETSLCARLSSNCESLDVMFYSVMDCATHQVFDDREYRCLGQWKEGNLLYTYTYTQRTDTSAHECFVGSIMSSHEIYIIEAGEHCDRKLDPFRFGMKLLRKGSCTQNITNTPNAGKVIPSPTTRPTPIPYRPSSARPPWKTMTEPPLVDIETNDVASHSSAPGMLACRYLVVLVYSILKFYVLYGS